MHPYVNIATQAARKAGKLILRAQDESFDLTILDKGQNDYVTQIDKQAEQIIIDTIQKAYPTHKIIAEESGLVNFDNNDKSSDTPIWIIDPLDGTTNFIHGFPQYCISIGVKTQDKITQAVVYDPIRDELFSAVKGQGAKLNNQRIRVSKTYQLEQALLGTGFPYRDFSMLDKYLELFKEFLPNSGGIRRAGAAALDLAYVACGRLDGFWEFGLQPWDIAAGSLLIQEAGGFITTLTGDHDFLTKDSILAGNPKIYIKLQEKLKKHF